MNFNQITKDAKFLDSINERGYERMVKEDSEPCIGCQQPTAWINVTWSAPLCSHECVDSIWTMYFENITNQVKEVREMESRGEDVQEALDKKIRENIEEVQLLRQDEKGGGIVH